MLNYKIKLFTQLTFVLVVIITLVSFFIAGTLSVEVTSLFGFVAQMAVVSALLIGGLVYAIKSYYVFELVLFQYNDYAESNFSKSNRYAHIFNW